MDSSYSNDGFWVKGIVFPPWRRVFEPTRGKCLWPSIIIIEQYSAHCTPYLAWPHMSTVKHSKLNVDLYKKYHSKHFFIWLAITWSGRVRDHQNLIFCIDYTHFVITLLCQTSVLHWSTAPWCILSIHFVRSSDVCHLYVLVYYFWNEWNISIQIILFGHKIEVLLYS